jgi:predicted phage-related endonuclease
MNNTNILNQLKNVEVVKHTDWLKTRRSGIGGSEIGTIMGVNKYSSIQNLYDYKTTGKKQEFTEEALERMHFGTVLEKVVVEEFESRNDVKCIEVEMLRSTHSNIC